MNLLLGYVSPATVAIVAILGLLEENGTPQSAAGWVAFSILVGFMVAVVATVWYYTWTRPPALKTESWLERH